jgi:hypothetical protein
MIQNTMLRRIFGPQREEVAGGWRKLYNLGLYSSYSTKYYYDDQIMEDEIDDARNTYKMDDKCIQNVGRGT